MNLPLKTTAPLTHAPMPVGPDSVVRTDATINPVDFGQLLEKAVSEVNAAQNVAQARVQAFASGAEDVSLEEVMVSVQKANLSLQGMIAVRNKLLEAYKDISNLPL